MPQKCRTKATAKGRWEKEGVLQNPTSDQGTRRLQLGHQQEGVLRVDPPRGTQRGEALGSQHQGARFPHKEKPNPETQPQCERRGHATAMRGTRAAAHNPHRVEGPAGARPPLVIDSGLPSRREATPWMSQYRTATLNLKLNLSLPPSLPHSHPPSLPPTHHGGVGTMGHTPTPSRFGATFRAGGGEVGSGGGGGQLEGAGGLRTPTYMA